MAGYTGLKENSIKVMERDEALIVSCRVCFFFIIIVIFFDNKKKKIALVFD